MRTIGTALAAFLVFGPGAALAADEWAIEGESKARFEAKVVDIACELTGDCPADCGDGKRQLGLLKDDGSLLLVAKNVDPFAGAVNDLIGFCGKRIVADGLSIKTRHMPIFALQFNRLAPDGKWSRANRFTKDWAAANGVEPNSKPARNWFRTDKAIKAEIEANGVFGIPGLKPTE